MNLKWLHHKLAFVRLPSQAEEVRLKLSRRAMRPLLLAGLLGLSFASGWTIHQIGGEVSALRQTRELSGKASQLEQDLQSKSRHLEELQQTVWTLSRQAAELRSRIDAMNKLELELRRLAPGTGGAVLEEEAGAALLPPAVPVFLGWESAAGPVEPGDQARLASPAGASLIRLRQEMRSLAQELDSAKRRLLERQEQLRHTPGLWPTVSRIVTSAYGLRQDPFTKRPSFHRGVDIAGKLDDPVVATASGTVLETGYDKLRGHYVILEHTRELRTWYMHLNRASVRQGELVDRGQPIGRLGTTGRSTGPHLHYEVLLKGKSTNPRHYLPPANPAERSGAL
jgi:murein DD-endopeptidase MepM/ murein hydrolase activator NlpD